MLGVIKIDEKKVLKPIDEMLADPWQVDIQELFEASVNEPDEIKKNLYDSLYTYILQSTDSVKEAETNVFTLAFNCGNAHKEPKKITGSHQKMAASNLF
jgi:hypothetical protein